MLIPHLLTKSRVTQGQGFPRLISLSLAAISLATLAQGPRTMAQTEPIWYNCLTREVFTPAKQAWCDRWQTIQNATLIVPKTLDPDPEYTTVTLTNGRYRQGDGQFYVELVNQEGWMAFGDVNDDGKTDAAIIFGVALDPTGQDVATYLTTILDIDDTAQALVPVQLGERILLNSPITINNSRITVPFLTTTAVAPRTYVVDDTRVSELAELPGPSDPAQDLPDGTVLFSQTSSYAVRVFVQNGQPYLNLYNKATGTSDLQAVPVAVDSTPTGTVYRYGGDLAVRIKVDTSGTQTIEVNGITVQDYDQVSGTVTYLPRIALPPNAVLEVTLADVSRADAPAIPLASQALVVGDRQVPISFVLVYDPEQIDPRFTYAVQARITVDGQLRFISTTRTPVITQNHPTEVEIIVDPVPR